MKNLPGLPGDRDLNLPELNLPKDWRLREDEHFIYLVSPSGRIEIVWSSLGTSREKIVAEIQQFFKGQP
jgi:hypothetical protein